LTSLLHVCYVSVTGPRAAESVSEFIIIIIIIINIIIIIIIILVITFMQGIYNYTPKTNHVSMLYSVAAVLYLQLELHVMILRP
jgi:heme/copper-type cytochrome/quinol oxidase subunit 2